MSTQPTLEFRSATTPFGVASAVQLLGSGSGSAIVAGQASSAQLLRVYNNFAGAGGIGDAFSCQFSSYDDANTIGGASTIPVTQSWLQVQVVDYDGSVSGQDTTFYPIGGSQKHLVPVNGARLAGAAAHYLELYVRVVVPLAATLASASQGLYLEYAWT